MRRGAAAVLAAVLALGPVTLIGPALAAENIPPATGDLALEPSSAVPPVSPEPPPGLPWTTVEPGMVVVEWQPSAAADVTEYRVTTMLDGVPVAGYTSVWGTPPGSACGDLRPSGGDLVHVLRHGGERRR